MKKACFNEVAVSTGRRYTVMPMFLGGLGDGDGPLNGGDGEIVFPGSKAGTAVDRSITFWLERNACRRTTLSAIHFGSSAWIFAVALDPHQDSTVRTTLRFIN